MSIVISRTLKAALTALTLTVTFSSAQSLVLVPQSPPGPFALPQGDIPSNFDFSPLTTVPVDLRGNGRSDIVVGTGVFPPKTRAKVPLRILRPNGRGQLEDATRAVLGSGALPSTEHAYEIGTTDLNGDGRPDLFVAAHGYDTTPFDGEKNVLLLSRADGTLQDRSEVLPGPDFTHSTTSGDVNGDGLVDIFAGNVFGSRRTAPYFLMARQDGGYDVRLSLPTDINELRVKFTAALLADIDRDGRLDLVLGTDGDNGFTENIILFNDGTGDFTKRPRVALLRSAFGTNQNVMDIVERDINGDGYGDLVFVGTGRTPFYGGRFIQILVNQGDGTFRDESAQRLLGAYSSPTGPWNKEIRFADLNGDGHLDFYLLMFVQTTREPVDMVWLNDGSGRFTPFRSTLLQPELGLLEATDLDGDGLLDFVLIGGFEGRIFYAPVMNRTPRAAVNTRRAKVDSDGDGREEIVVRASDGSTQMGRLVNGQFQFSPTTAPSSENRVVAIADLNNNGRSDLVFQNITQGEFGEASTWLDFNQTNQRLLRNVKRVWDVQATGDLDGDGFGDLVWRYVVRESPDTGVSYIWFTNGAPNLTGTNVTQVRKRGGAPLDWQLLGAVDINADGAADMAYVSPSKAVRILMATPGRTCANLSVGSLPAGFEALKFADFSGNRRGDILVRNATSGEVQLISLNAVGLTLPPPTANPDDPNASCSGSILTVARTVYRLPNTEPTWSFYAAGDYDGNGVVDIVWRQPNGTLTTWLLSADIAAPVINSNTGIAPVGLNVLQP
jgi:hypothetical protein